jgi:hypothetical protein
MMGGASYMQYFSQEARERPTRTLQAARILHEQAATISRATHDARADEMVIALVQPNLQFGGTWIIARDSLITQVPLIEDQGGWSLLFAPATDQAQVEARCDEYTRIAYKRWDAMQRWIQRQR